MKRNLIFILLTLAINVSGQTILDSAKVFQDFELHGRTTAGAYSHFTDLINEGRKTTTLSIDDLQKVNNIIKDSKVKKHRQIKFGLDNIFIIGFTKTNEHRIIIASGQIIVNLTSRQEYHLTDNQKIELKKLIDTWRE